MRNKLQYIKVFISILSKYDYSLGEVLRYALLGIITSKRLDDNLVLTKLDEFILFQMIPCRSGKKILADKYIHLLCVNHYSKIISGNASHKFLFEKNLSTNCQKLINTELYTLNKGVNL